MWADQNFTGSHVWDNGEHRAGCSKRLSSKAAGEARTGGVPSGAHGATNKEHQVCARRRVVRRPGPR
jgi:hypothetical protein